MIDEPMRKVLEALFGLQLERRIRRDGPLNALENLTADYGRVHKRGKTEAAREQAGELYRIAISRADAVSQGVN